MKWMTLAATLCAIAAASIPPGKTRNFVGTVTVTEGEAMPVIQPDHWAIMTIIGEAASEPLAGQIAVGNVIRNRMMFKYSSDGTVIGTVLKPRQFSCWDDRARIYAANTDIDSDVYVKAAEAWYRSKTHTEVGNSVLYHTHAVSPIWKDASGVRLVRQIGAHLFYHDSGKGI